MTNQNSKMGEGHPLALALPLSKLQGRFGKSLRVPPGRKGIAFLKEGEHQLFDPGEVQVLSPADRLKGDGAGFYAGYVPQQPFNGMLKMTNLLSADEVLLDLSLLCTLKVSDPALFFIEEVLPKGSLPGGTFLFDRPELFHTFANFMRNYLAEDLVNGKIDSELIGRAFTVISPIISAQGLRLESIDLVTCWKRADRLLIEKQVLELDHKMGDLVFEQQLAAVKDAQDLEQFLEANDLKIAGKAGLSNAVRAKSIRNANENITAWVAGQKLSQQPGQNFRLKSLLIKKELDQAKQVDASRYKPRWWLPRTLWMVAVLIIAAGLTYVLTRASETLPWAGRSEFYIAVWMFALGALLESAAAIFKNWEKFFEKDVEGVNATGLDQFRLKDRTSVDLLVREQCTMELQLQRDIINELRGRVYQAGNSDLALEMRRLEIKIEDFANRIRNNGFGPPPYLREDARISEVTWNNLMDQEEMLLIKGALLSEEAHALQQRFSTDDFNATSLKDFESELDEFYKSFATRERVVHSPELA
jgi:hypothetical protein